MRSRVEGIEYTSKQQLGHTVSHKSLLVFLLPKLNVEKLPHTRTVLRGHNMEGPYEDKI